MSRPLPEALEIRPIDRFDVRLRPPGSKSLTNRALLLAALGRGPSRLENALFSDDSRRMLEALSALGVSVETRERAARIELQGVDGVWPRGEASLQLGNAGTAMRSLAAACALGPGPYVLDGIPRMRERPIGQLVEPLRGLGARVDYLGEQGFPPLRVRGGDLRGGVVRMAPTLSSQYLSALLMIGPYLPGGLTLAFDGPVTSRPYVEMTLAIMGAFGASCGAAGDFASVRVEPGAYRGRAYAVEPDASNATYFLAAAAATPGSRCVIEGLGRSSVQGDVGFAGVLGRMGAGVAVEDDSITVTAPPDGSPLRGVDVDLGAMPDTAQTLAAAAVLARGPTTIRGVGNLRVKETDRLEALRVELGKLGAEVVIQGDDLRITPPSGGLRPARIATYDDHRMAMSFAVIGLRSAGVVLLDPSCVNKTYPSFFDDLAKLGPPAFPGEAAAGPAPPGGAGGGRG